MGQRSPHNARYQKHTKPEGKTRRSAAAVKPKRDLGKTTADSKGSSKKGGSGGSYRVPMTPEYRRWRNVWWGLLAGSAACAALYLALDYFLGRAAAPPLVKFGLLVGCYIFLGIGMWVDWAKVRPARKAALAGGGESPKPSKKVDRPTDTSAS